MTNKPPKAYEEIVKDLQNQHPQLNTPEGREVIESIYTQMTPRVVYGTISTVYNMFRNRFIAELKDIESNGFDSRVIDFFQQHTQEAISTTIAMQFEDILKTLETVGKLSLVPDSKIQVVDEMDDQDYSMSQGASSRGQN